MGPTGPMGPMGPMRVMGLLLHLLASLHNRDEDLVEARDLCLYDHDLEARDGHCDDAKHLLYD